MVRWLGILVGTLRSCLRTHRELALENLVLRQQLAVWKAREPRPRFTEMDRLFWSSYRECGRGGGIRCTWCGRRRSSNGIGRDFDATGRGRVDADRVGPGQYGASRSDSADERRQSAVGCAPDPRRVAEARAGRVASDGF